MSSRILLLLLLSCVCQQVLIAQPSTPLQKTVNRFEIDDPAVPKSLLENQGSVAWTHWDAGPVAGLSQYAQTQSGAFWLGSSEGAARFDPKATHLWDRWHYFAGKAWLPDDQVEAIYVDPDTPHESVWIRTPAGVAHIQWLPMKLQDKAHHYDEKLEQYHVRKGFVARSVLIKPGDIASATLSDTDNDGLWTAMYIAAQAYRYAATGLQDARNKAQRGLEALMKLETIDPIPGFYARTYRTFDEPLPHKRQWRMASGG